MNEKNRVFSIHHLGITNRDDAPATPTTAEQFDRESVILSPADHFNEDDMPAKGAIADAYEASQVIGGLITRLAMAGHDRETAAKWRRLEQQTAETTSELRAVWQLWHGKRRRAPGA